MTEIDPTTHWFKSSRSAGNSERVEAAFLGHGFVGVRDSKDPGSPALVFTPGEWDAFTASVKEGEFRSSAI
ncbi:DUF397 domain-containing protein [Nocardia transvalensis]|uniref:DUF397 domain-containing protein n=1 Tax=Nocardia transvalensis TaxID=37333 RepID=UPI000A01C25B|nr:DUF397 domain-containing protein [Nocardia transvalensis]